ncbi:MAG: carbon-nitrogen hydrolase family protein [Planctomycetes bacterium]|nr:carbon-nitrogen hydrolase family protein [Planctomycetota bacterium]
MTDLAHKKIHVACSQIVCRPGDIAGNGRQVRQLTTAAAKAGARFVLFGEGALTGYLFQPDFVWRHALAVDSAPVRSLRALSRRLRIVIAVGSIERADDAFHVSHFVLFPDGRVLVQRKHNLTDKERAGGIVPGPEERRLFTVGGVRFGICICADSGIPDIWNKLAAQGCQVSCNPCAGGGGRQHMRRAEELADPETRTQYLADMEKVCFSGETLLRCHDRRMAMITVNLAGDDGIGLYHPGHSLILDSAGHVVAMHPGEYVAEYLAPVLIHGVISVPSRQ